ncbi:uncharacterized protein A4U43_C07F32680 [Asparagus officinalis]|uniref:Bifunctional inhibitor/plant lipid transfer protein/seed storage helical domain-containing protein n=1 Tax=Asparagus officinalis TaxID=4686 RepID=A0A5P1EGQ8_ASPOF|nr:uncharacterized protein A4U43_C07F32680 [Asparagus officinalis]
MTPTISHLSLAVVLTITLWAGASAQSTSNCMSTILSLAPCLNYITGNASTPTSSCCSRLATVVKSKPICLCAVLKDGVPSLGITINRTQALQLPVDCKVKTPPVSRCNGNGGGLRSAPTAPSSVSPSVPATPSGYGSQTIPTGGLRSSNGSSLRITFSICFSLLFIVIYLSAPLNSL